MRLLAQSSTAQEWLDEARKAARASSVHAAIARTAAAWLAFWDRSWVIVDGDQAAAIAGSEHPLRIGYDSAGGNKFPGRIQHIRVYGKALAQGEIAQRAKTAPAVSSQSEPGLLLAGDGKPRAIGKDSVTIKKAFTLEAQITPTALTPGRIFDRVTAGGSDGFLFDTHPGDTLRLIVGSTTLTAPRGILQAGKSHHVAASCDSQSGAMRIYLDGRLVAQYGSDASSSVTRGYTLQRYVQACGGRGPYPIKFNGGMFTVEPKPFGKPYNADWRAWGDCHWWQNVRHMYHPMLAAGDFDLMDPLFQTYAAVRPLAEARSRLYHGAEGCYFPETMTVWGTYSNGDYGWNRVGHQPKDVLCPYWQYAWNQGPELVALMLDRWDYTGDEAFLRGQVLPAAESVLKYFDTRFKKDAEGRIVLDPTQAVETYWHGVVNDMPSTAGLNDITARLCALPETLASAEQRAFFARMRAAAPKVPVEEAEAGGKTIRRLAPARSTPRTARTARTRNCTASGRSGFTGWAGRGWRRPARPISPGTIISTAAGATTATVPPCWAWQTRPRGSSRSSSPIPIRPTAGRRHGGRTSTGCRTRTMAATCWKPRSSCSCSPSARRSCSCPHGRRAGT